jgi:hypothetical protein
MNLQNSQEFAQPHAWVCKSLKNLQIAMHGFATVSGICSTAPQNPRISQGWTLSRFREPTWPPHGRR